MIKNNISTIIFSIIACLLVACIVIYPVEAFHSALDGLKLWFNVVCPALLPFFICVEILIGMGIVSFFGSAFRPLMSPVFNVPGEGSFGFFMSMSSGYPVGAKIIAQFRQEMLCNAIEGQRLLSLCSTSGPLFIIGAVATGIMNSPAIGFFLALSHYLSAIAVGFLMRFYKRDNSSDKHFSLSNPIADMLDYRRKDGRPIGMLLGDAVKKGVNLILMIGGFIILFSVISRMLKISGLLPMLSLFISRIIPSAAVTPEIVSSFLIGFLEVTNGAKECAALNIPLLYKTVMVSFMIGFGGLSVNAQVMSIIAETDLKFGIYFVFKLLQGITASIFSYFIILRFYDLQTLNAYNPQGTYLWSIAANHNWGSIFMNSSIYMLLMLTFILSVTLLKNKRLIPIKPFKS